MSRPPLPSRSLTTWWNIRSKCSGGVPSSMSRIWLSQAIRSIPNRVRAFDLPRRDSRCFCADRKDGHCRNITAKAAMPRSAIGRRALRPVRRSGTAAQSSRILPIYPARGVMIAADRTFERGTIAAFGESRIFSPVATARAPPSPLNHTIRPSKPPSRIHPGPDIERPSIDVKRNRHRPDMAAATGPQAPACSDQRTSPPRFNPCTRRAFLP